MPGARRKPVFHCPHCQREFTPEDFAWETDLATCRYCGEAAFISAVTHWPVVAIADIDLSRPPEGCRYRSTPDGYWASASAFASRLTVFFTAYGLLFLMVWLSFVLPSTLMRFFGRYDLQLAAATARIRGKGKDWYVDRQPVLVIELCQPLGELYRLGLFLDHPARAFLVRALREPR